MAKKRTQRVTRRDFSIEDARRLAVMRQYLVISEKKVLELLAEDRQRNSDKRYAGVKAAFRSLLASLDCLRGPYKHGMTMAAECGIDEEQCPDGSCNLWCS